MTDTPTPLSSEEARQKHADSLAWQSKMFAFVEKVAGLTPIGDYEAGSWNREYVNGLVEEARSIMEGK